MNEKTSVPARSRMTLGSVEGDLLVNSHAVVVGTGTPPILKISGTVYCEGNNTFECNLFADRLLANDDVTVNGNLAIAHEVKVEDGHLKVFGSRKRGCRCLCLC